MTVRALVAPLGSDGTLVLALDVVRRVIAEPVLTPVPTAAAVVLGLANVRGDVVPVLDTPLLLDRSAAGLGDAPFALVVETDRGPAGLAVAGVPVAADVEPEDVHDPDALVAW